MKIKKDKKTAAAIGIGLRIGRLLRQYGLRIEFARGKAALLDEERRRLSAAGDAKRALEARVSRDCWKTYAANLEAKREELAYAVSDALIGYSQTQREIWFGYFVEGKSTYEIAEGMPISPRAVQRTVASMRQEGALRFAPMEKPQIEAGFDAETLAEWLEESPPPDYVRAVGDALSYGAIDVEGLESDPSFRHFCETGERAPGKGK